MDELSVAAEAMARDPSLEDVRRRFSGDSGGCCIIGPVEEGGVDSNALGVLVVGSWRFRFWVMVSSGGVRALELAVGARGGMEVEVGLCVAPLAVDGVAVGWVTVGRWLGLSRPGGRGGGSLWRLRILVPGISESSGMGPSVRLRGFMMRFGAPPEPMTSG